MPSATTARRGRMHVPVKAKPDASARILAVVRRIPRGSVCAYGEVARLAGLPRRARLVGTILKTTSEKNLPWHRVITAQGKIAFPVGSDAHRRQLAHLKKEGVKLKGQRVDMQRHAWPREDDSLDRLLWG